ncbi:MAG: DUF6588 family protein, partial [Bacteroidota bacterium]
MDQRNPKLIYAAAGIIAILFCLSFPSPARAQDLGGLLKQLGVHELARDYLRPGVDAVGYSINSGYSHTANVDTVFHVWAGVKIISTFIPESDRTFTAKLPAILVE